MSCRFTYAVAASAAPQQQPLIDLAKGLVSAIEDSSAEGEDSSNDPAVLVLGAFVAFATHADVNSVGGYRRLISMCNDRIFNAGVLQ